ncbi:adhesion G-protein coupled receptor G5-like [Danio aesculapii]|uniref:adhesion G-protein coupled receptor G5-like n=1 Tax=Danio aesculapii TaxID=1142201 RepID=UPI0024C05582|nr:adhesion G-protein coupled receptor G5-like [Danio aesculapii]
MRKHNLTLYTITRDKHTSTITRDKHTSTITRDNHTSTITRDKHTSTITRDKHTSTITRDNHTSTITRDKHTSTITRDKHTSTITRDKHTSTITRDKHTSTITRDKHTSTITRDNHTSTITRDKHTTQSQETSTLAQSQETSTLAQSQETSTLAQSQETSTLAQSQETSTLPISDLEDENGYVSSSKAAEVLDIIESNLVNIMEKNNKSNVMIAKGNITGLLHIQDRNTETKDITICYCSNNTMVIMGQNDRNTGCVWTAMFPSEAFNKSRLENNGSAFVGVLRFTNMRNKNQTKNHTILNNEVYGITMGANISNLTNNIEITFTHKDLVGGPSCTSWNGKGNLEWTTFGCETKQINSSSIKCSCSHLTFFAVLMSVPNANDVAPYLESLTLISSIGCGISVFFLAIALFMHFLLRKAKSNQATKILINMFCALFLLNVSFLSNESVANSGDKNACVFIALLMHYSMLTTFTWFFIQALHMYLWLIRQNVSITNYMRKITVLGWVFSSPAVIAVVSVGGYNKVTLTASSGKIAQMCWITNPFIHYILNTGYYIFVFIFTIVIFIITILTRIIQSRDTRAIVGKRQTFRKQLMMVLSLFLLFGLTWAVAFFSYGPMLIPSYYIFCALNSLQGFFLFLYYYHIHKDVAGHFSDDPKSSSSITTIVPPNNTNNNAEEHVYDLAR